MMKDKTHETYWRKVRSLQACGASMNKNKNKNKNQERSCRSAGFFSLRHVSSRSTGILWPSSSTPKCGLCLVSRWISDLEDARGCYAAGSNAIITISEDCVGSMLSRLIVLVLV